MGPEVKNGQEAAPAQIDKEFLRQNLYLAEQAAVGGLPVVPGESWALHYSTDAATRATSLQGLLDGTVIPAEVSTQLKPDGLIYDFREVTASNLSEMLARVRDMTAKVQYYDYQRYAHFVASMGGTGLDVQTADAIYDRIAQSRVRSILYDSYEHTGKQQITTAVRREVAQVTTDFPNLPSGERIFEALKLSWVSQDLRSIPTQDAAKIISQLSASERAVFDILEQPYRQFVQTGSAESFTQLTEAVKSALESPQQEPQEPDTEEGESGEQDQDQEMQDHTQHLNKEKKKVGPPQTPKDPGIPPDDKDEYKTSKEKSPEGVYFYVTPSGTSTAPLLGYFAAGRKSYYDVPTKTWSKKKVLSPYQTNIPGDERQTISSASIITGGNLKALPIPNGYALDASSLKFQKGKKPPQLFRDQNGCFYIKADKSGPISVDFLKEPTLFTNPPIPEDTKPMYQGQLSPKTEAFISTLAGGNIDKALAIQKYILENHFYPAEGDLDIAQALQYKLRQASSDTYIQTIDTSKYLECYSTHTLGIAMLRKMGVPARLVVGDHVQKTKDGKAQLDSTTGHAWTEVWDGAKWVRFDFTPKPEHKKDQQQDQNKDQDKDQGPNEPGQQADDNGMDQGKQGEEGEEGEGQPGQGQPGESSDGQGQPGETGEGQSGKTGRPDMRFNDQGKPQEASNEQMQSGQQNLQQAQETMKNIQQKRDQLDNQVNQAGSFQQLEDLKNQAADPDLFEDMKAELQDKIKALEQAKKDQLKEALVNMAEDGFIENEQMKQLIDQIDTNGGNKLDQVSKQIEREGALHHEYLQIKTRVESKVEEKFDYLMSILPTEPTMVIDEDLARRKGVLNRRAMMKPINLIMGTVKSPRVFEETVKPLFLAGIAVDFSRSVMTMDPNKRRATEDLLVFVLELFDKVVQTHGYMRYSLTAFHDKVFPIKGYDQDYGSLEKYAYPDGTNATVKARLMRVMRTEGGTNILPALQYSAAGLNQEAMDYPDYLSCFYFIGDGEDSRSDPRFGGDPSYYLKLKRFVEGINPQNGFGDHVKRAIFLGSEAEKIQLSNIFGDESTSVCADFDQLVDLFLDDLAIDVQNYMANKI